MSTINTRAVKRRQLRFESVDEALRDLEGIVAAHRQGRLRALGNWTPGQALAHVAAWIEYGYDGYPIGPPPWFVRPLLKMLLKRQLRNGMPGGVRIPRVPGGTVGQDDMPVEQAAERLRAAFERLRNREPARYDSPAFGPLSDDDRIKLNLRHAELHLSFLDY
jgi:hypothetical protein